MKFLCLLTFVCSGILITGCADDGGAVVAASAPINKVCPCMGGKVDGTTTVDWNGKTVGFCCPPCIETWNEMSDDERTTALAEAAERGVRHDHDEHGHHGDHDEQEHDDHDHADHDHDNAAAAPVPNKEPTPLTDGNAK
jgi:hypothetical protein